ncbi:hypothetical protein [Weeksella virosa]|uniref:CI repressor n=1 Tax=Weeksella virosa (strain ATCC 43766 / DSM 16922 / JCM 21250 / CCUG 30538 / CDC 9751 / IAM 14551 / NBRC 16016 / NCTC 11634 / CL345/78) TaxID=865938 RepID=F0NX95_WEEVC|nr:hypothetical protein [Weeksella virosa]ADX66869.1 hypothetical protein Weevi_0143 [Weeksella virosa DSM 16922]MDK7675069.1 hypothetical protein [Weeksella virosa]VEH63407.1 Uncharacterised protein [Weeksella virosa]
MDLPIENQRIKEIINFYCKGNINQFSKEIGISQPRINRLFSIDNRNGKYPLTSFEITQAIINKFIDVNPEWLLTGRGDMLKDPQMDQSGDQVTDPKDEEIIELQKFKIKKLEEEINALKRKLAELSDYHPMAAEPNPKLKK